jgi:hypothetical protein
MDSQSRFIGCLGHDKRAFCLLIFALALGFIHLGCEKEAPVETETPSQPTDILGKLRSIPGIEATEVPPLYGFPRAFQIDLLQPLDHGFPEAQKFRQRIYLSYVDDTMPMVFAPSGYGASLQSVQEIAGILGTNHLSVAHRFFVEAEPNPLNWRFLTVKQAAADHHRIVTLFKTIFKNVWISSGVSKGGMTCLFHKRYYPDDVGATIAYVAPMMTDAPDTRFSRYLEIIGDEGCRNSIRAFQRRCLLMRDSLISRMPGWFSSKGMTVSRDMELVFEETVCSYDWTFWQYHTKGCDEIPGEGSSIDAMFSHLAEVARMERGSDVQVQYFTPYVFQAYAELGYPERNYYQLKDLLRFNPDSLDKESLNTVPFQVVYDRSTCQDVIAWLQMSGNNIVYLYGSIDPWTGGAVELTGRTNALKIIQPGGDHRIKIAGVDERDDILNKLEAWLGIDIHRDMKQRLVNLPARVDDWELTIH